MGQYIQSAKIKKMNTQIKIPVHQECCIWQNRSFKVKEKLKQPQIKAEIVYYRYVQPVQNTEESPGG